MCHQSGIIAAHRTWCIEQRSQQILPDIPNPRCVLLQAVHDEADMFAVQLQQLCPHDLGWVIAACNANSAAGAANCLLHQLDDLVKLLVVNARIVCQNVVVDNCVGRSGANGLKFGTVSRGGFRNFKVTNITIYDTYRSAITFAAVDGGLIDNILVDGVRSINTGNVIFLRIGDRWGKGKQPSMKNVTIQNVYAEVPLRKPDAGYNYEGPIEDMPRNISPASIVGLPDYPIENITLKNITMVYPGGGNKLFAYRGLTPAELDGIPEMRDTYPEFSQFRELPAWGFYIRHAKNITMDNVQLIAQKPDYRPAIVLDDVHGGDLENVTINDPGKKKNEIVVFQSTDIKK